MTGFMLLGLTLTGSLLFTGLIVLIIDTNRGISCIRNLKVYRKQKGGVWWKVKSYHGINNYVWMSTFDTINFPEFDGGFMENSSTFYVNNKAYCYYGWEGMENKPTESY